MYSLLLVIVFVLFVVLLIFIYIDIFPYFQDKIKERVDNKLIKCYDLDDLSLYIKSAAIKMTDSKSVIMSFRKRGNFIVEYRRLKNKIKFLFKNRNDNDWIYGWNKSFLYIGLFSFCKGKELLEIKKMFDKYYVNNDGSAKFELKTVHQIPFATAAIILFQKTKELKYKNFCDYFYNRILEWKDPNNLILYFAKQKTKFNYHFVDELGMTIPFLYLYGTLFKREKALHIAQCNIDYWIKQGLDSNYLPVYNIIDGIKLGPNNWGRGCSWFILALLPFIYFNERYKQVAVRLLDSLNILSDKNYICTQFIGTPSHVDSSATIPYLMLKYKLEGLTHEQILNVLLKLVNVKGQIIDCSGETYGINRFSEVFGPSEFVQGVTLMFLSYIYEDRNNNFLE